MTLSVEQQSALELMNSGENVFITGGAGSGKSHLLRQFVAEKSKELFPILASTGAAAVLVGGRTFHSFFGLGIVEGGFQNTFDRATKDRRVIKRLKSIEGIILDEVSMLSGEHISLAEAIACRVRDSSLPWGGLRVIAIGDFAQLPPVTKHQRQRDWAFLNPVWERSGFLSAVLRLNHRTEDEEFLRVLQDVRVGKISSGVSQYLESQMREHDPDEKSTRLFPRRDQAEEFNRSELNLIPKTEIEIPTIFLGEERFIENMKKAGPLPEILKLKEGARVLFVQNDPQKRWVNGTRGTVIDIDPEAVTVEKDSGRRVTVEKVQFGFQDADGNVLASSINFPLTLAYATTIHKSQGATLDKLWVDLSRLWEPGHAYVALSRLRTGEGLHLLRWSESSFIVDPQVTKFYRELNSVF